MILDAVSFDKETTQIQMINFDKRAPDVQESVEHAPSYPLIAWDVQEVIDYGSKLCYYGPPPTDPMMSGFPHERSKSCATIENHRKLAVGGKMFLRPPD